MCTHECTHISPQCVTRKSLRLCVRKRRDELRVVTWFTGVSLRCAAVQLMLSTTILGGTGTLKHLVAVESPELDFLSH